jgi:hypothetical protein
MSVFNIIGNSELNITSMGTFENRRFNFINAICSFSFQIKGRFFLVKSVSDVAISE